MSLLTLVLAAASFAPPADTPPPVPVTRDDMKKALEASKNNQPRLPLPPLTDEEKEKAAKGDWSVVNNGRMRRLYLPAEFTGAGFTREPDPNMSLGYPFQTMLFWIVSRGNNCTYCMGHQESKLTAAGLTEDRVAALDGDWAPFTPAERAMFGLAKRLTFEPHEVTGADLDRLRTYYNDRQILEAVLVIGNFNAMNRWTGALRIPQEDHRVYLTPTSDSFRGVASRVAPLGSNRESGSAEPAPQFRPKLESREQVEKALASCRTREPRLPLVADADARAVVPAGSALAASSAPLPQWVRLLANFPKAGAARVVMHLAVADKGKLDPKLRAEIAWVAARNDRAWYALNEAHGRLRALGFSDDQVFALDGDTSALPAVDRAVIALTRKLTVDPARVTDADVAAVRAHLDDRQTAEVIHHITEAAFFDRLTEAAALRAEAPTP